MEELAVISDKGCTRVAVWEDLQDKIVLLTLIFVILTLASMEALVLKVWVQVPPVTALKSLPEIDATCH
jgi:hypothetical protein